MVAWVVLLCLGMAVASAQQAKVVDLQQMRNDIEVFEAALNKILEQVFSNPFALTEDVKGVYLKDYGAAFSFVVNIKAAIRETPFGPMTIPEAADPKLREQKIQDLRERVINSVGKYGDSLGQLQDTESVTVVAHIADQNFSKKGQNKTIIVRVLKRDLNAYTARQLSPTDFRKRVLIVEY